ncbi:hypothetical protein MOO46_07665 (plasmid) [Apilactobacillus apisilvae]|uniref:Phage protein n=1 Tax=Apilactobacillus apisilvae TaxID=2923364 RepID=A0ABY4PJC4_9LACO|nr:hypothetical protein [Apilactobacillus apisilvae]UQS85859.1 hypothetical protein MOO46_07665 [Apilactobacillus apisilvae]
MDKDFILSKIKLFVPNDSNNPNYDSAIEYVVDKVMQDIANYTHIPLKELPDGLKYTAVGMSVDLINSTEMLVPQAERNNGISSVTEGDESVTFKSIAEDISLVNQTNSVTKDYYYQLNSYRRLNFD